MDSESNDVEATRLYQDLSKLWWSAVMWRRKLMWNSVVVIKKITEEDRAWEMKNSLHLKHLIEHGSHKVRHLHLNMIQPIQ